MTKTIYQFNFGHYDRLTQKEMFSLINAIRNYLKEDLEVSEHPGFSKQIVPKWFGFTRDGKILYAGFFGYRKSKATGTKNYYCKLENRMDRDDWSKLLSKEVEL